MGRIEDYTPFFSKKSSRRQPSAIRVLNKIMRSNEGMISLAGGNPNFETFPFESLTVNFKDGSHVDIDKAKLYEGLDYGPTQGLPGFVRWLKAHQKRVHSIAADVPQWDIMVTTGSQEGIHIAFDMLLNDGDSVLLERPAYTGALAALLPLAPHLVGVETDEHGMIPESLERILSQWDSTAHPFPKVLYTVPTGQNPAGCTSPIERKRAIYEIASKYNLIIIEDDPYYFLSFLPERVPSYFSFDVDGRVIRLDSLSKILAGGLRVGWATAPVRLIEQMELRSMAVVIHASGLSQVVAYRTLESWGPDKFDRHVEGIAQFYRSRRDTFLRLLDVHLKGLAEWSVPVAGMFVWMKLLNIADSHSLILEKAVSKKVLLVPGGAFMPDGQATPYVRASYSSASEQQMDEALRRLAELLKEAQAK